MPENISLQQQLEELKMIIGSMNPAHYKIKSEYHRLMYSYTLQVEIIEKALNSTNEA